MRFIVASVGRWSANGAEKALFELYAERVGKAGKPVGLGPLDIKEVAFKKPVSRQEEAKVLLNAAPKQAFLIALDERGKSITSKELAALVSSKRDEGFSNMVFLIGGADGHGEEIALKSHAVLNMGAMTWPHLLVRGLIAEQIYRAVMIISGHPYHRD